MIAVVVITHNRLHLLRSCVHNVLSRTSSLTTEIVIWDNASTDGTAEFLRHLDDPRIHVHLSDVNIGMNGYARGFGLTSAPFIVELDDDIVDAPDEWDRILLESYERLPEVGFLAADLMDDPNDDVSRIRHHVRANEYSPYELNGVALLDGPAGGGCAITARSLADRVDGFRERPGEVFWQEESEYQQAIRELGYSSAVLEGLRVHHTGGGHYRAYQSLEKRVYWDGYYRQLRRRNRIKRILLNIPYAAELNRRFEWFQEPMLDVETAVTRLDPADVAPPGDIAETDALRSRGARLR